MTQSSLKARVVITAIDGSCSCRRCTKFALSVEIGESSCFPFWMLLAVSGVLIFALGLGWAQATGDDLLTGYYTAFQVIASGGNVFTFKAFERH